MTAYILPGVILSGMMDQVTIPTHGPFNTCMYYLHAMSTHVDDRI